MDQARFWHRVAEHLGAGTPVFIAIVAAATRGSPGTPGARLLLAPGEAPEGTIGGGGMEARLIEDARQRLATGPSAPRLDRQVHRKTGSSDDSGLICAGEQRNLSTVLDPATALEPIRRFCAALDEQIGACATLTIDATGLTCHVAGPHADGALRLTVDGERWRYVEESLNRRRLAIVGAGHCGAALASLARGIGYQVDVFDDREGIFATREWPADVACHKLASYTDLAIAHPGFTRVVVMTTAVTSDIKALAALVPQQPAWLGVMGSRAKISHIQKALAEQGMPDAERRCIHGPIGLKMKSETPPEIAVSIMAEILSEEHRATEGASSRSFRRPT